MRESIEAGCPKRLVWLARQIARRGEFSSVLFSSNRLPRSRGMNFVLAGTFVVLMASGCSKAQPASVLGDAAHPAPVHFYTVAEETARRRIQAVGSLYALEESTLSSEVEGRV